VAIYNQYVIAVFLTLMFHKVVYRLRVRTDIGTDCESHPVHCRLNQQRSIFVDRQVFAACLIWHWLVIINAGDYSTCWIWSTGRWTRSDAIIYSTAAVGYQL